MSDLIDTTEMYLRTIFELEEEGVVPLRARIAERLGHSGPTVSQTVARMERDGLLHVSDDRHLELSDAGRAKATRVMRKHRLAERLLTDVIGLEWEFVHDEACRWEHVISERVERKLLHMIDEDNGPLESPYGNPIPGLDELGGPASDVSEFRHGVVSLVQAVAGLRDGEQETFIVRRLGERLQIDADMLGLIARSGLRPGSPVKVGRRGSVLLLDLGGAAGEHVAVGGGVAIATIQMPLDAARHVFVEIIRTDEELVSESSVSSPSVR